MADKTEEEEERLEPMPHTRAKITAIAGLIGPNGRVHKAEEKAAKARSELGNIYQGIEADMHGNRKAVKLVRSLVGGTTDAAYDFMRTFLPLAHQFGLIPNDDLADIANRDPGEPPAQVGATFTSKLDDVKKDTAQRRKPAGKKKAEEAAADGDGDGSDDDKEDDPANEVMPKFVGSPAEISEQERVWKLQNSNRQREYDERKFGATGAA